MTREDLIDEIWSVMQNVQDYDTGLHDFAKAVVRDVPLIAAAPGLLAALQRMVTDYGDVPDPSDADGQSVIADARAALAKAVQI
jgi:hypothetical protein